MPGSVQGLNDFGRGEPMPSRRRYLARVILIALCVVCYGARHPVQACQCAEDDPAILRDQAFAVVSGRTVAVDRWETVRLHVAFLLAEAAGRQLEAEEPPRTGVRVSIEVEARWTGEVPPVVHLTTGHYSGDCGVPFRLGERYLVYIKRSETRGYETSRCAGTKLIDEAADDLTALGPPTASESGPSLSVSAWDRGEFWIASRLIEMFNSGYVYVYLLSLAHLLSLLVWISIRLAKRWRARRLGDHTGPPAGLLGRWWKPKLWGGLAWIGISLVLVYLASPQFQAFGPVERNLFLLISLLAPWIVWLLPTVRTDA